MSSSGRQEMIEKALATAAGHRRLGNTAAAWRCVDDVLSMGVDSAALLEMIGLLNLDDGNYDEAAAAFQKALAYEPGRKASEEGLGLATVESKRQVVMTPELMMAEAAAKREIQRQAGCASSLSLFVPGLGQARLLDFTRAGLVFGGALLIWLVWALLGFGLRATGGSRSFAMPTIWFFVGLFAVMGYHIWAALDCHKLSREIAEEEGQVI